MILKKVKKSKKEKIVLTPEQIYKLNKKKAKTCAILAPATKYLFLILTIIFFLFMIQNSIGNVAEIIQLLDNDKYNAEELVHNYQYLISKWGEWEIAGGGAGLTIRYVDIANAVFSGLMITYSCLTIAMLLLSIVLGKIVFPQLSKMYKNANDEMVDMATLTSASKIEDLCKKETKIAPVKKKKEGGWF